MSDALVKPAPAVRGLQARTLRKLYLTLFLRGRSSRGQSLSGQPGSLVQRLARVLLVYVLVGFTAMFAVQKDTFLTALFLHTMGMLFTGMFIAASTGEVLFNKEEAEILGHRPVDSRQLLWAKVTVLVQVAILMGCAYSLPAAVRAMTGGGGKLAFPLAHLLSISLAAVFCTSVVVMIYQLCLRWVGRERLDNIMTTVQVILSIGLVLGSQAIRPLTMSLSAMSSMTDEWWMFLLPPAWFAGLDVVLTGGGDAGKVVMAVLGLVATGITASLAFGKLAATTQDDVLAIQEEAAPVESAESGAPAAKGLWVDRFMKVPPLSLLLRHRVTRAAFRLCVAYMMRDRDTKLRLYPGIAPVAAMPVIFLFAGMRGKGGDVGLSISAAYLGLVPLMAMNLLQFSQQWQASDVFRLGPAATPARFIRGALVAVLTVLVLPAGILLAGVGIFIAGDNPENLLLILPGLIALPAYALLAGATGRVVPLSRPTEEARTAGRGAKMLLLMMSAIFLGGSAYAVSAMGYLWLFLAVEAVISLAVCLLANASISRVVWEPLE